VFITASVLLAFGFGIWLLKQYFGPAAEKADLAYAAVSFLVGAGLIAYERRFLKKTKGESYL
jgi:hypothetical protein